MSIQANPAYTHIIKAGSPLPQSLSLGQDAGMHWKARPRKPVDRRLVDIAKAVRDGYCRLQMPLKLALAARERQWLGMG